MLDRHNHSLASLEESVLAENVVFLEKTEVVNIHLFFVLNVIYYSDPSLRRNHDVSITFGLFFGREHIGDVAVVVVAVAHFGEFKRVGALTVLQKGYVTVRVQERDEELLGVILCDLQDFSHHPSWLFKAKDLVIIEKL
jgi:hypothetical protein